MALFEVKDMNGKSFSGDTDKLFEVSGDVVQDAKNGNSNVSDSLMSKNRLAKLHDVEYVNSAGEAIDAQQVIKDMSSGKTKVVALDVEMEATHSGKNHNYCVYYEDSMEKDAESFVNPFQKPVLKNHNAYSGEPIGRIKQAWFGESKLTNERSAIHLKTRITDQDAIPKFLDGRYSTVSISGTMGTVICNICGKTVLKNGKFNFCGHWRGETYKDQVCYWGAKDIEYHEVSTVNTPADDFAQVMKVTVITDADDNKDNNKKEEHDMAGISPTVKTDDAAANAKKAVCDIIDQMLGNESAAQDSSTTPDKNKDGAVAGDTENTAEVQDNGGEAAAETPAPETQAQDSSNEELDKVKKELEDAKAELESVKTELQSTKDNLEKTEKELKDSQEEATAYKDKCVALATSNKEFVVDSIITKEKVAEDKLQKRKEELMKLSMKELNELSAKDAKPETRTPAQVANPTLANPDKNASDGRNADAKNNADKKAKKTVDDFANEIVGKLIK